MCIALDGTTTSDVESALREILGSEPIHPEVLAGSVKNKIREKWDSLLPDKLLEANFGSLFLDPEGVRQSLRLLFQA